MPTPSPIPALLLATRNGHKAEEIRTALGSQFDLWTLRDIPGAPDPVEDGSSFAANARIKARVLAEWLLARPTPPLDRPWPVHVLADDSGLEVDALGGAPGVHSARYASGELGLPGNAPDRANNARLLRELTGIPPERRSARFRCVLAWTVVEPGFSTHLFEGTCEGQIGFEPRGHHGFGYDPLFLPHGHGLAFAELGPEAKNAMSHRARALAHLALWLNTSPTTRSSRTG